MTFLAALYHDAKGDKRGCSSRYRDLKSFNEDGAFVVPVIIVCNSYYMKKSILGVLIALLVLPSISMAYTPIDPTTIDVAQYESRESLEELRKQLMLLIIDLLKIRIQELIALRDGSGTPAVLGVATSSPVVAVAEERRRSGGGGGGSSRSSQAAEAAIVADLQQTIADLLAQLNKLEEEQTAIEELQARVAELETELAEREADITNYQNQISSLTEDIDSLEDDNAVLTARIAALETLNQQLRDAITAREADIVSLRATVAQLEQQRDEQQATITTLNQTITSLQGEITNLEIRLNTAETAGDTKDMQITALTQELSDLQAAKTAAETAHNEAVAGLEAELTAKRGEITTLQAAVASLQAAATVDAALIASLQVTITTLESDVEELETQLSTQVTTHAGEKAELEADIVEREATIAALNTNLANLRTSTDTRIAELEAEITTLTTQLDEWRSLATAQSETLADAIQLLVDSQAEIASLQALVTQLQQQIADLEELIEEQEEVITGGPAADCILESANLTSGATIVFCTPTDPIIVGESFPVLIGVDSGDSDINGVAPLIMFDTDFLRVDSITKAGSDYSLWTIEPVYSNTLGEITVGAGTPIPLSGTSDLVTVYFTPLASGTTTFMVDASILAADGLGTNIYVPSTPPIYTLGIAPYEATLNFSLSSNNPESAIIIVEESSETSGITIFVFDIEAEDGPIFLDTIYVRVDTPGTDPQAVIDGSELNINGLRFNDNQRLSIPSTTDAEWHVFELGGYRLADANITEAQFSVDLNPFTNNYSLPQLISTAIDLETRSLWQTAGYIALDPNTDYAGVVTGDTHTITGPGVLLQISDTNATSIDSGENNSTGKFEMTFEATAFEDDFYFTDFVSTTSISNGFQFNIDGSAPATMIGSVVSSTADQQSNGVFSIREGETESITLTVYLQPTAPGFYRISLANMYVTNNFDGTTNTKSALFNTLSDFKSPYINLIN